MDWGQYEAESFRRLEMALYGKTGNTFSKDAMERIRTMFKASYSEREAWATIKAGLIENANDADADNRRLRIAIGKLRDALARIALEGPHCDECSGTHWVKDTANQAIKTLNKEWVW